MAAHSSKSHNRKKRMNEREGEFHFRSRQPENSQKILWLKRIFVCIFCKLISERLHKAHNNQGKLA